MPTVRTRNASSSNVARGRPAGADVGCDHCNQRNKTTFRGSAFTGNCDPRTARAVVVKMWCHMYKDCHSISQNCIGVAVFPCPCRQAKSPQIATHRFRAAQ